MKKSRSIAVVALSLLMGTQLISAQTHNIAVDVKKPGAPIQKTMYGIFFEDINFGADGGLYAEMVKNRSFEFPQNLLGWTTFGKVEVKNDGLFSNNPHYVRLSYPGHDEKRTGLDNEGFFGFGLKKDADYRFSVWARTAAENATESIRIEFIDPSSAILASQNIIIDSKEWKKYQVIIKSATQEPKGRLRIFMSSKGSLDLEHVSVFPVDTWKGHENGLRKDLAQALYDLKPGYFAFRVDALWKEPIWKPATSGKILLVRSKTVSSTKTAGSILSHTAFSPTIINPMAWAFMSFSSFLKR